MKIGLIDVDGHNFPNLALMKISAWHKSQGDDAEWWLPMNTYNTVYKSKVFTFTPDTDTVIQADTIIQGGTGYDLQNKLSEEIEHTYPDYSIYPQYSAAYGFLTRGCPRSCEFCIVSSKEGRCSHKVADLSEFWREQKEIKLLDPNLLACKEHEELLHQLANSKAWVDFTQGVDIRLITESNVNLLNQIKIKRLHFAWDNPDQDLTKHFDKFNQLSKIKDYARKAVYILTNYGSTHEQDLYRIYTLRDMGYDPYIMIYDKQNAPKQVKKLQRWVNSKYIFRKCDKFEEYKYV